MKPEWVDRSEHAEPRDGSGQFQASFKRSLVKADGGDMTNCMHKGEVKERSQNKSPTSEDVRLLLKSERLGHYLDGASNRDFALSSNGPLVLVSRVLLFFRKGFPRDQKVVTAFGGSLWFLRIFSFCFPPLATLHEAPIIGGEGVVIGILTLSMCFQSFAAVQTHIGIAG